MGTAETERKTVRDKDVLAFIDDHEDPCVTAVEVADAFDVSQQAAHWRLSKLADRGDILRKKAGAKAVVWWLAGDYSVPEAT